jgi:hypothetical protein
MQLLRLERFQIACMDKISFDVEDDWAIAEFQNGDHHGRDGLGIIWGSSSQPS